MKPNPRARIWRCVQLVCALLHCREADSYYRQSSRIFTGSSWSSFHVVTLHLRIFTEALSDDDTVPP
jgi:hypothetical protein